MERFNRIILVAAMLLAGCAAPSKLAEVPAVGPDPGSQPQASRQGSLQVFSAQPLADTDVNMREFFWDDYLASNQFPRTPAHTDYTIYAQDGRLLRQVRNARNENDAYPTVVPLPPGLYQVEAQAKGYNPQMFPVRVPVVIERGRTTILHLVNDWHPAGPFTESQIVRVPGAGIAGWRARQSS